MRDQEFISRGFSTLAWLLQAFSGLLLIVLLLLHMVAQHFAAAGLLTYQGVVAYLSNPLVFAMETVFLATVLFHALAGVRAILFDLGLAPAKERLTTLTLVVLGSLLFLYGLFLTWSIVS
jgi:succinate dehydrogenase cytochrome b556 subunit